MHQSVIVKTFPSSRWISLHRHCYWDSFSTLYAFQPQIKAILLSSLKSIRSKNFLYKINRSRPSTVDFDRQCLWKRSPSVRVEKLCNWHSLARPIWPWKTVLLYDSPESTEKDGSCFHWLWKSLSTFLLASFSMKEQSKLMMRFESTPADIKHQTWDSVGGSVFLRFQNFHFDWEFRPIVWIFRTNSFVFLKDFLDNFVYARVCVLRAHSCQASLSIKTFLHMTTHTLSLAF